MHVNVWVWLIASYFFQENEMILLHNGHSHNDYTRERPLLDALELGFTSIEVDVFFI